MPGVGRAGHGQIIVVGRHAEQQIIVRRVLDAGRCGFIRIVVLLVRIRLSLVAIAGGDDVLDRLFPEGQLARRFSAGQPFRRIAVAVLRDFLRLERRPRLVARQEEVLGAVNLVEYAERR